MLFKLTSYLKFLIKSTNQHGVHSPFVFAFVTKCLYSKKRLHPQKTMNVLLKSINYFGFRCIQIPENPSLKRTVLNNYPQLKFDGDTTDMLFIDDLNQKVLNQVLSTKTLHNDSMILVDGIHSNQERQNLWESLIQMPYITVSVDMYHCGALFIRREQKKEHFTVRV